MESEMKFYFEGEIEGGVVERRSRAEATVRSKAHGNCSILL